MKYFSFFLLSLYSFISVAQVVTNELPPSFKDGKILNSKNISSISIPKPDLINIEKEDIIEDRIKEIPWRFGIENKVNLNILNSGNLIDNGDGSSTWLLRIVSKDAKSINLNFDQFNLPQSTKLFIYNDDYTDILGAITQKNNNETNEFAIRPIKGNAITIEMIIQSNELNLLSFNISGIVYGYRSIHNKAQKAFNSSGSCNININCSEGNNWQDVKRSIVMILRANNTRWCSGALINNVRQDSTPYILTANHCGLSTNSIFIFNYESPNCSPNTDGNLSRSMSGAYSRATHTNTDFHLFELNTTPPLSYEVFYAGWDRTNTPSNQSTGIHHPDGDVMKISIDYDSPITSGYYTTNGTNHWTVKDWDKGTTEGGSSGSPLFNEYQEIIGQLHGGNAACGNDDEDYYGKFSDSWNTISGNSNQLQPWLDPDNTGTTKLPGLDTKASLFARDLSLNAVVLQSNYLCMDSVINPGVIIKNLGNDTITSFTINYSLNGVNVGSIPWTGSLIRNHLIQVTIPSITLQNGSNTIDYIISSPNGSNDQNSTNNAISATSFINKSPIFVDLKLKTDDYGNETTWNITEQNTSLIIENGGPFSQVSGGTIHNYSLCLYDSCFTLNLFDSQNDGFNGSFGNGYLLITSQNGDTLIFENNFTTGSKSNQFCIQKVNTGIKSQSLNQKVISVFPNPIKAGKTLKINTNQKLKIDLFDFKGSLITSKISTEIKINQKPGIYLLKVSDYNSGNKIATEKIIVQ